MKLIHRGKGSRAKKGSSAPWQSREKIAGAVDGGAASNSRQIAPDDVLPMGTAGYASSRDEAFFEASPWLDSDCEDDFFSVNGDVTPARTFSSTASNQETAFGPEPQKLPTLEAILRAEPLKPPTQMKLGDLLKEKQEGIDGADRDDLSRASSSRSPGEASWCCIPHLARTISYKERRKHK